MTSTRTPLGDLATASRRLAQRVVAIGHNRLELLMVELQEERERLLLAILLALGSAAFGLLAGAVLTVTIVLLMWESPFPALLVLFAIYALAAALLYLRLDRLQREWRTLSASLDQLQKDRQWLDQNLP